MNTGAMNDVLKPLTQGNWTQADVDAALAEIETLRVAIRRHRDERADDRCWLDDDHLYAVLGDGIKCDRRVGDKEAMLANCSRFIANRCESGGWQSYASLEAEIERLRRLVARKNAALESIGNHPSNGECHWTLKVFARHEAAVTDPEAL